MFTSHNLSRVFRSLSSLLLAAVLMLTVFPAVSSAQLIRSAPDSPSLVRLSWTADPWNSMSVTWQDSAEAQSARIEYIAGEGQTLEQIQEAGTDRIQKEEAARVDHTSTLSDGGTQWHATLTGLKPETVYTYRIVSEKSGGSASGDVREDSSGVLRFTTPPEKPETLTFAYFGDVQVNQEAEGEFTRWGQLAEKALSLNPDMRFGIMGGDIVESGISTEQFDMFFDAAAPVFSGIPLFATNGNHESNFLSGKPELYLDSFTLPVNGPEGFEEEFYSFDYGPVHIMVLNSWVYSGEQKLDEEDDSRIASWIRQDLQSAEDSSWKIAVMHHPLYAVHSDRVADLVQEHWGPLLEEGGLDLLLCGHQHVYCRSLPLTGGLIDYDQGITQVMGVSGEKFYSSADGTSMERTIYGVSNYQIIHASDQTLEIQCFDRDGQELDYAVLNARSGRSGAGRFEDVPEEAWYAEAVRWAVDNKVFNGVSDTEFAPDRSMTRAMFATVLWRMNGSPAPAGPDTFTDVREGQWYTDAVTWASEQGFITGYGGAVFGTDDFITREQIAAILFRYTSQDPDMKESAAVRGNLDAFQDCSEISEWAAEALSWASGIHMINGMGGQLLVPKGLATRAQVATMLMNYSRNNPKTD